jgi:transcription elongation factor GreB
MVFETNATLQVPLGRIIVASGRLEVSRAFVDEDSVSDETGGMHDIPLPLPAGAKNYMTAEGAARMEEELRSLTEVERPRIEARQSESDALRRLAEIDRRISYLARMGSALEVVGPPSSADRIVFGLFVAVRDEGGDERELRIVGVDESDPERGLISWASPLAKALIGKRRGETAVARLPRGETRMTVVDISIEPIKIA